MYKNLRSDPWKNPYTNDCGKDRTEDGEGYTPIAEKSSTLLPHK